MPKTFFNQGTGTSPVLAEGKLLVFVQIGNDSLLLALNPVNGEVRWKGALPIHNNSYATPVVWKEGAKSCAGMTFAGRFTAFDLADGKEIWWVDGIGFQACATPVVAGDRLVISAAGAQGELANMTPPPGFDELIQKHDSNGDGLIAYRKSPATSSSRTARLPTAKGHVSPPGLRHVRRRQTRRKGRQATV